MHARAIAAAGGVVVAVADIDVDRARALDRSAQPFASIDDLLGSTSPDVLHVCSPSDMHADAVARALAAGAHVIVEKPVAPDAETTRRLVEQAQAAERVVVPVHQFLFQPGVRRLVERSHELGRLVRCSFVAASAGAEKTGMDASELVSEILPHPLSLFARLAPAPIGDLPWHVIRPARGELRAIAISSGASLEITITSNGRPTRTELEVMGTDATGHADLFHGFAIVDRGRATRVRKLARPFTTSSRTLAGATGNLVARAARRETAYPGLSELVRATYKAIVTRGPSPIAVEEMLAVAQSRERILEGIDHPE
jgi:predicted dehydrogenase